MQIPITAITSSRPMRIWCPPDVDTKLYSTREAAPRTERMWLRPLVTASPSPCPPSVRASEAASQTASREDRLRGAGRRGPGSAMLNGRVLSDTLVRQRADAGHPSGPGSPHRAPHQVDVLR